MRSDMDGLLILPLRTPGTRDAGVLRGAIPYGGSGGSSGTAAAAAAAAGLFREYSRPGAAGCGSVPKRPVWATAGYSGVPAAYSGGDGRVPVISTAMGIADVV